MKLILWTSDKGDVPADIVTKNNFGATAAPTAANDSSQGYQVGSQWVDTTGKLSYTLLDASVGAAVWAADGGQMQAVPVSKTVSGLLLASDLLNGLILVNQAGAAASAQQLPLGTSIQAALGASFPINGYVDFSVVNTSVVAAEAASITVNTGVTILGSPDIAAHSGPTVQSSGRFRLRKTAANTFVVYRLA